jgi:hypothetical protein
MFIGGQGWEPARRGPGVYLFVSWFLRGQEDPAALGGSSAALEMEIKGAAEREALVRRKQARPVGGMQMDRRSLGTTSELQ